MLQEFCDYSSGYYHLRGSDIIPSGIYWIEVFAKGHEATLSFRKDGEEIGFVNAFKDRLWNGFWECEMLPCCDLRYVVLFPVESVELAA